MSTHDPTELKRRRGVIAASLAAAVVAGLGVSALAFSAPAASTASRVPVSRLTPFDVANGEGASISGMTEYEAEAASTNGSVKGPDYTQGDLITEASGRQAVQLTAQGQYVQFTLTAAANAFDVSYALPQGASGTLSVYVNGAKQSQELALTSQYSYVTTGGITGSKTHHFFNDARMMFSSTLQVGATVRLQVDAGDSALPYTIDVADFYAVPAAASQPSNSISVVSEGADATGAADSTSAFSKAISAANAAGESVWIPSGTFLVNSALQMSTATIEGAGDWYSIIRSNKFIDNPGVVSGPINLSGFAIMGSTVGRHDDSTANAINGSLGTGSVVNGLWIQDTNVGFWLQYGNTNITVENCEVLSTDADGLNFNGNATNDTVKNNFIRNTGDDGLAIWSYPAADSGITFSNNTIVQPNLANGIADYGGSNNTITGNVIADTNALGSGMAISNEAFIQPLAPLSGTITVSNNTLIRTGAYNPNWGHAMGAIRFDAYDYAIQNVAINVTGNAVDDSPYEAFEIVGGAGTGLPVTGLTMSNNTVDWTGTTVFQAETGGSASVSGLTATAVGVAGAYNYSYPGDVAGAYTFNLGSGNSGWSTTPVLTSFPSPVGLPPANGGGGTTAPPSTTTAPPSTTTGPPTTTTTPPNGCGNLALNQTATASGYTQTYVPANAVDGDTSTYWESTDSAFPQWYQVDLGSAVGIDRITMDLPPSTAWGTRTQTITIQGSTDGSNYTTIEASAGYTFDPSTGNTATVSFSSATARYVKLTFTANTGWPAGQLSELQVYGSSCSNSDLALGRTATASGYTQTYVPANAVDGDTSTYWESTDSAFPQWFQVDLGSSVGVGRIVMDLPPSTAWGTRTQTILIQGSTDGSNYTTIEAAAGYTFDPSTGNTVTVTVNTVTTRYLKLTFTANTGWPAGQLSELQVYGS